MIKNIIKTILSKTNFALGFKPKIEKSEENPDLYIPKPYKSVCLISADFELAWAFRYSKNNNTSIDRAIKKGLQTRKNVPKILKLCEDFNIPITWATVGHLFLDRCSRNNELAHPEIKRLPKFENEFWKYSSGDWFKDDPCTDYQSDPAWYCPDLINQILESPAGHEIGCHTFSHIDCSDAVCTDDVFLSEIQACKNASKRFKIKLKSFVHPGHQIGNLMNLFKEGFTSFRTDFGDKLSYPKKHPSGLWEFKNSLGIEYSKGWSVDYHKKRFITIIKRAIRHKRVCVLWFHPSFNDIIPDQVMPDIFKYLNKHRDEIWLTTHQEYAEWLNKQNI